MTVSVVGVSHRTAPVDVRERFAFGPEEGRKALMQLREEAGLREAVLLSTCNRTEVYLFPGSGREVIEGAQEVLAGKAGDVAGDPAQYVFVERGWEAVRHLFQVSSGLDSMVTGEAEIQGQVREAYRRSAGVELDPPLAGPVLHRMFQMALAVGGEVRAQTQVGTGTASVASVSVELARKVFGDLSTKRVLVVGAGEAGKLTVEALERAGVEEVMVANRTYERAVDLASRLRGHPVAFHRLGEALRSTDIVLTSTAAPHPVLSRELVRDALPGGPRRPMLLMDLAIPRDIEPGVSDEPNVFLYNVDDLMRIVEEHVQTRRDAVPEARRIIDERCREFRDWYASLEAVPLIRSLRDQAESVRQEEVDRLLRGMDHLQAEDRERIERFSQRLLGKLLHDPTVRLREGMTDGKGSQLAEAVRFLYRLDENGGPSGGHAGDSEPGASRDEP